MSGPGVGFEYPPQQVSWLKRDVLLFANSIGATADELHLLYVWEQNIPKDEVEMADRISRSFTPISPSSLPIPSFCVGQSTSSQASIAIEVKANLMDSFQRQHPGSH